MFFASVAAKDAVSNDSGHCAEEFSIPFMKEITVVRIASTFHE